MKLIKRLGIDVMHLFFPKLCATCKQDLVDGEEQMCMACLFDLPVTNFHLQKENALSQKLKGRFDFVQVLARYYFNTEGNIQEVLHQMKYRNNKELAVFMGQKIATELAENLTGLDCVVPIPLHAKREAQRGYNQSAILAKSMAETLGLQFNSQLVSRIKDTETQTKKTRAQRIENMENAFEWMVPESDNKPKHILLIDDVITTGATIESCILAAPRQYKFSILAIAAAIES